MENLKEHTRHEESSFCRVFSVFIADNNFVAAFIIGFRFADAQGQRVGVTVSHILVANTIEKLRHSLIEQIRCLYNALRG